jgi:hypothetical protein
MFLPTSINQMGFKHKSSTKHAYFFVNETIQIFDKPNSPLYVAALDAAKVFDRQWRDGLFYKLIGKIPGSIWRILFKYYECSSGIVRTNGGKSDEFDINQGVKQAGVLSPALFNFVINDLIEECLNSGLGAMIGDLNVCIVAYCDDIILLSPTKAHMDR